MKNAMFALFAIVVLCGCVVVYALSNQIWSNEVTETVTSYVVTLTSNNTSPVLGYPVEFSALLTGNGSPQATKTVDFYKNGTVLAGSDVTDANGIATYVWVADGNCTWKALYTAP